MNPSMEFARKIDLVYAALCKPLCQELAQGCIDQVGL